MEIQIGGAEGAVRRDRGPPSFAKSAAITRDRQLATRKTIQRDFIPVETTTIEHQRKMFCVRYHSNFLKNVFGRLSVCDPSLGVQCGLPGHDREKRIHENTV